MINNKIKTKKSLGQHFLRDSKILKKIADFAKIEKTDTVVEIGPGEGGLTKLLLEQARKVIAIEKDEQMVSLLKKKFRKEIKERKLEVIEGDVLKLGAESLKLRGKKKNSKIPTSKLSAPSYKLIGNIPYYITGALFKKALEAPNPPKSITFVVQKEVAERIIAKNNKESILSISIKVYGKPEYGGVIKAGSFYPKPKVDSAIISVRNISKEKFSTPQKKNLPSLSTDISLLGNSSARLVSLRKARSGSFSFGEMLEKNFFKILKAGFAHKRKILIKNLEKVSKMPFLGQLSKGVFDTLELKKTFKKCGISEKVRAEDLKVENWISLAKNLFP